MQTDESGERACFVLGVSLRYRLKLGSWGQVEFRDGTIMALRFQNKSHISSKRIDHCLTAIAASRARSNSSGTNRYNKPRLAVLPLADSLGEPELVRFAGKTLPSHTPKILFIWSLLHSDTGHMPVQRRGEAVGNLCRPSCLP